MAGCNVSCTGLVLFKRKPSAHVCVRSIHTRAGCAVSHRHAASMNTRVSCCDAVLMSNRNILQVKCCIVILINGAMPRQCGNDVLLGTDC